MRNMCFLLRRSHLLSDHLIGNWLVNIRENLYNQYNKKYLLWIIFLQLSPYDISTMHFSRTFLFVCACECVCMRFSFSGNIAQKKEKCLTCHMLVVIYASFFIFFWKRLTLIFTVNILHLNIYWPYYLSKSYMFAKMEFKVGHAITKNVVEMGGMCPNCWKILWIYK